MLGIMSWDGPFTPPAVAKAALSGNREIVTWANDVAYMGLEIDPDDVTLFFLGVPLEDVRKLSKERQRRRLEAMRVRLIDLLTFNW